MAVSGVGRGRGWLNLNKQPRPGGVPESMSLQQEQSVVSTLGQLNISEYSKLINQINMLNENDDGILLNQKLKNILEVWRESCKTSADVQQSVSCIYQACLTKDELGSKVVSMITANSFATEIICDTKIRNVFITLFQMYFEKCQALRLESPQFFRRSIRMFGEFFHKGRMNTGRPFTLLAEPLVQYLEMLLKFAEPEDLELFTIQLYLNGSAIRQAFPDHLNRLTANVRNLLIMDSPNSTLKSKVWLLLAVEITNHRFGVLPADLQEFYRLQLGDKALAHFQGSHGALSVQTVHSSKVLDGFQSNVNVLQVSTPEVSPASEVAYYDNSNQFYDCRLNNTEPGGMTIGRWESRGEKTGRPILGAGARLNKENHGGRKHHNSQSHRKNKGWEHDDRFENNYD